MLHVEPTAKCRRERRSCPWLDGPYLLVCTTRALPDRLRCSARRAFGACGALPCCERRASTDVEPCDRATAKPFVPYITRSRSAQVSLTARSPHFLHRCAALEKAARAASARSPALVAPAPFHARAPFKQPGKPGCPRRPRANLPRARAHSAHTAMDAATAALFDAAAAGNVALLRALIAAGVEDLNDIDEDRMDGWSALHCAVSGGNPECVHALLDAGANANVHYNRSTPLHMAAIRGSAACVRLLLAAGSAVNARTLDGESALVFAAQDGHTACVQLLIDAGADLEIKEWYNGLTALGFAASGGHLDCVRALIDAAADVEAYDQRTRSSPPLLAAAEMGHAECVAALLDASARVDNNCSGRTPLQSAARAGTEECMQLLLARGADPGLKSE